MGEGGRHAGSDRQAGRGGGQARGKPLSGGGGEEVEGARVGRRPYLGTTGATARQRERARTLTPRGTTCAQLPLASPRARQAARASPPLLPVERPLQRGCARTARKARHALLLVAPNHDTHNYTTVFGWTNDTASAGAPRPVPSTDRLSCRKIVSGPPRMHDPCRPTAQVRLRTSVHVDNRNESWRVPPAVCGSSVEGGPPLKQQRCSRRQPRRVSSRTTRRHLKIQNLKTGAAMGRILRPPPLPIPLPQRQQGGRWAACPGDSPSSPTRSRGVQYRAHAPTAPPACAAPPHPPLPALVHSRPRVPLPHPHGYSPPSVCPPAARRLRPRQQPRVRSPPTYLPRPSHSGACDARGAIVADAAERRARGGRHSSPPPPTPPSSPFLFSPHSHPPPPPPSPVITVPLAQ